MWLLGFYSFTHDSVSEYRNILNLSAPTQQLRKALQSFTTNGQNTDVCYRNAGIRITFDSPNLWNSMINVYIKEKVVHKKSKLSSSFPVAASFLAFRKYFLSNAIPPIETSSPINCPFENYSNLIIC